MKKTTLTLFLQLFIYLSFTIQAQWINTNIPWNGILSLAVKGDTIFAGTNGTGFFRSSDNGATWTNVNNGLHPGGKLSIAVSGNNIFVGTYEGGVWLSTDNGTSWNPVNSGISNLKVYSIAISGNNIFAGTFGGGIFFSNNNGANWTPVNNGLTDLFVRSLAIDGNKIFAGTLNNGVFLSLNNGTSWTPVNNGFPAGTTPNAISIIGNNTYVGTSEKGMHFSGDNGTNWNAMNTGLYEFSDPYPVYSIANVANKLFTGTSRGGVFLFQIYDSCWDAVNSGFPPEMIVNALTIKGDYLFAATNKGVWRRPLSEMKLIDSIPLVVDNSAWFPPAELQIGQICSHFSLVYYLKSYLWNKHYSRDPNLPENKFSPGFTWNQQITTSFHNSGNQDAFDLMTRQGCATTANFPLQSNVENLPSRQTKESALLYRSSSMNMFWLPLGYSQDSVNSWLDRLKDSLSQGSCFTLHIPIFNDAWQALYGSDHFYHWDSSMSLATMNASHSVAVVGYNDNLQAFKIINSHGQLFGDNGYFYMGYNWFYNANWWDWATYFLQEDFNHLPKLTLNLSIRDMITGEDINNRINIFVDTVYTDSWQRRFDYNVMDHLNYTRLVTLKKINNQVVPSTLSSDGYNRTNNIVFLPRHNHNGNRELLEDLTDYVSASDFNSLELLVVDPISATFIAPDNSTICSYVREAKSAINEVYLKFLGTPKRIIGQVIDLPDTIIVTSDFYSYQTAFCHTPPIWDAVFIKTCTSVLKRKKITFSIEDTINFSNPPYFTSVPAGTLRVKPGNLLTFQFKASDPDNDLLKYSLSQIEPGVQIDSLTGLFQYQSNEPSGKQFTVLVTDGLNNVPTSFSLICNNAPVFTVVPVDTLKISPTKLLTFQFQAQDLDNDTLKYYLSVPETGAELDSITGLFQYQSTDLVVKKFTVVASDGLDNVSKTFVVRVQYGVGTNDSENLSLATLAQNYPNPFYSSSTISFVLARGGITSLKIYNLLGQEITTLLSKELNLGTYNNIFNAGELPAGIYTYRLEVNGFVLTKKMAIAD